MKKYQLISLGCPKNLTDAEELAWHLDSLGYALSSSGNTDIAVINTCAFLKSAVKESEGVIEKYIALKKRGKVGKIIISGCLVEREREKLLEKYPEVDAIVGISSLSQIINSIKKNESYILPHSGRFQGGNRLRLTLPHSAYLKIADGCDNRCSYCTIPAIRGGLRSKPEARIVSEAASLARSGAVEISLIAQDTAVYGTDLYGRPALKNLLKKLSKMKGVKWLRLMYMYPDGIDRELLNLIKDSDNICHYLEMPLQHISDPVLKRMNRRSSEKEIRKKLELIKKYVPDMAVRTTFIAGFPGETEKDFKKLLSFVKEAQFNNLAVFKYSREKGTPAFDYPEQVNANLKAERYAGLLRAQSSVVDGMNSGLIGREMEILMDSPKTGRTYMDAPDIDGSVEVKGGDFKPGDFVKARITEALGYRRKAEAVTAG